MRFAGRVLPAELAVLAIELAPGEAGAWLNSRGTKTGAIDLVNVSRGRYRTKRIGLPVFVSNLLASLYRSAGVAKGAPDLVLWRVETSALRFVEVKCPHWDAQSEEQVRFSRAARGRCIRASVCEWEFVASGE